MSTALIALTLDCDSVLLIAGTCKASVNKSWYIHMTWYYLVIRSDVCKIILKFKILVKYMVYLSDFNFLFAHFYFLKFL